jgi:FtsP/CotA-like multicopper oxidase with cupredoxin domain
MEDLNSDPRIVECNVEAKHAQININGVEAKLHTYNGYFPAPTIRFNKGDTLKIHYRNGLDTTQGALNILGSPTDVVSIHTHGFHVSPLAPSDDPNIMLDPGESYDYVYDTSKNPAGTLNFYHSHVHERTAELFDMAGALVTADETDVLAEYETHILFIKDISIMNGEREPYFSIAEYVMGKEGNMVLVNGQVNPVLNIKPGQVQRWRVINACTARFLRLSFQGHSLNMIGADGDLLDKPYPIQEMLLTPSERIDVLVKADQAAGSYKLVSLPYNRGCGAVPQTVTLMTVNYNGEPLNQALPQVAINANAERVNLDFSTLPYKRLVLSMMGGRGYINGQDFDVNPLTIRSEVDTYEVWDISSQCMMDHVFHIHINHFQVLGITGSGYPGYGLYTQIPAFKDSVFVPRGGTVRILVRVADFTGMTMFHCHIVEHEDIGMMGMWDIVPAGNQSMPMN